MIVFKEDDGPQFSVSPINGNSQTSTQRGHFIPNGLEGHKAVAKEKIKKN